jgi:Family of unknown function (DUF5989)
MVSSHDDNASQAEKFSRQASLERPGFVSEYLHLMRSTRKWWLLPLIVLLLGLGGLMVLSSTAAAPFIYTLF